VPAAEEAASVRRLEVARYSGAVCRICRRAGKKLYLKGERCYGPRCAVERRAYPPGQHGQMRRKIKDYGMRLQEKQNLRRTYGMLEKQFRRYFREAAGRKGVTGELLLQLLERRLDNAVYRLGLARSRAEARQLVAHRHFAVDGRMTDIPSCRIRPGQVIEVRPGSRQSPAIKAALEQAGSRRTPAWLSWDAENLRGTVVSLPSREDVMDVDVSEQMVVEFYSR
jgi:small subunit ribosomal protein S4